MYILHPRFNCCRAAVVDQSPWHNHPPHPPPTPPSPALPLPPPAFRSPTSMLPSRVPTLATPEGFLTDHVRMKFDRLYSIFEGVRTLSIVETRSKPDRDQNHVSRQCTDNTPAGAFETVVAVVSRHSCVLYALRVRDHRLQSVFPSLTSIPWPFSC